MENDISPIPAPETNYNSGGAMDWQRDRYNDMVQAGRPGLDPSSGSDGFRGSGGGRGFAGLSGWAFPAGMIGAVVGGILGRGPVGAIVGAVVFAGAIWVLRMVLHGIRGNAATRPILPWGDQRRDRWSRIWSASLYRRNSKDDDGNDQRRNLRRTDWWRDSAIPARTGAIRIR